MENKAITRGEIMMKPTKYAATPQDRMYTWALFCKSINQCCSYFNKQLSNELLEESVLLIMKIEPVLKCRFVDDNTPYWEELPSP
jgi:NRPS condensation-like uncharacterized protein